MHLVDLWEDNLMVCRGALKGAGVLAIRGCTETSCCRVCEVTAEKESCFPLMQNLGFMTGQHSTQNLLSAIAERRAEGKSEN